MTPRGQSPSSDSDALNAALRHLARRPRSESEVRRLLSRRFVSSVVETAVGALKDRGILDDAAFALFCRESRERHKPKGAPAIRWELVQRGVPREVAEEAVAGLDEEGGAYRAASALAGRLPRADFLTFRNKLAAYLRRRGFAFEVVRATVSRLWEELSDPADGHIEGGEQEEEPEDIVEQ